jgi:DNA-binding NarL/FixJ family response regulator
MFANEPDYLIAGQITPNDEDLAASAMFFQPDALLVDTGWEGPSFLAYLDELKPLELPTVVLIADGVDISDLLSLGVTGMLPRSSAPAVITAALKAVEHGLFVTDPVELERILPRSEAAPYPLFENLTPREMEVLQLLAEGLTNKAIAHRLEISEHTVKFHVNAIMGKLQAQSRTEAVVRGTQLGLVII